MSAVTGGKSAPAGRMVKGRNWRLVRPRFGHAQRLGTFQDWQTAEKVLDGSDRTPQNMTSDA